LRRIHQHFGSILSSVRKAGAESPEINR